jgi:hypothetical protein
MITLTREEAQQVLDALDEYRDSTEDFRVANRCISLIETLRTRLSAPEPEQVAGYRWEEGRTPPSVTYTAPPQREWQGLTDEERTYLAWESNNGPHCVAMTEALLKEKNSA